MTNTLNIQGKYINSILLDASPLDLVIAFLLCGIPFVDMLNGVLQLNGIQLPLSVSQAYKFPLLALMVLTLLKVRPVFLNYLVLIGSLFLTSIWVHTLRTQTDISILPDIIYTIKILSMFVAFFYCKNLVENSPRFISYWLFRIMALVVSVIAFNILLGFAGIGASQYGGSIGGKGFFIAGNEMSALIMISAAWVLFFIQRDYSRYFIPLGGLLLGVAMLKATKVSMLGILILFLFIPMIPYLNGEKKINTKDWSRILLAGFILMILAAASPILFEQMGLLDRWDYFSRKFEGQILTQILSSRDIFFAASKHMFALEFDSIDTLFGIGFQNYQSSLKQYLGYPHLVEMDIFDVFYTSGLFTVIFCYAFYLYVIFFSFKHFNDTNYPFAKLVAVLAFILMSVSILAGHILFSGVNGIFIGISLSMAFLKSGDKTIGT